MPPNNFISISIDDLIAHQTVKNLFGNALHTPNMDRLSDLGVSFENAFAQVALCNPSRASILSGQRPESTNVHENHVNWYDSIDISTTLPAIISKNGFETTVIGKVYHQPASALNSLLQNFEITGFSDQTNWNGSELPFRSGILEGEEHQHGDYINTSRAIEIIETWTPTSKNALFLGIYRPHQDWTAPKEYFDLYDRNEITTPLVPYDDIQDLPAYIRSIINDHYHDAIVSSEYWVDALHAYFASISFADAQVGRVLDALENSSLLNTTGIVLWSDHGYHLGDKNNWHKFTLWEESGRAPLIFFDPTLSDGQTSIESTVELLDIAPTVLEMLGVDAQTTHEGKSLYSFFSTEEEPRSSGLAFTSMYGSVSVRTDTMRYIHYEDGSEELYDLVADPNQTTNLVNDSGYATQYTQLRSLWRTELDARNWKFVDSGFGDFSKQDQDLQIVVSDAGARLLGGQGSDTYFLPVSGGEIIEGFGNGTDQVFIAGDYTIPENVEIAIARHHFLGWSSYIIGNSLDNVILGGARLEGKDGNDELALSISLGRPGYIDGGNGHDQLEGSNSDDELRGGSGNDDLTGYAGDDVFFPGTGKNTVFGNGGTNTVSFRDLAEPVSVNLGAGISVSLSSHTALKNIHNIEDTYGNDVLIGDRSNNTFYLSSGFDSVYGAAGVDAIYLPEGAENASWRKSVDLQRGTLSYTIDKIEYIVETHGVQFVFEENGRSVEDEDALHDLPEIFIHNSTEYLILDDYLSREAALSQASELGGHLLRIEDAEENEFIFKTFYDGNAIRLDASDLQSEGRWLNSDGSELRYFNWLSEGEPNNVGNGQHWAYMAGPNGEWGDHVANGSGVFNGVRWAPSIVKTIVERPLEPPSPQDASFMSSRYIRVEDGLTREEALAEARNLEGTLLRIESAEENRFIYEAFYDGNAIRLDASDSATEGVWQHSDGSPLDYTNWLAPNEPNNINDNQHFAYMSASGGKWGDQDKDGSGVHDGFSWSPSTVVTIIEVDVA